MENFEPLFKEHEDGRQFVYTNDKWTKCGESTIDSIWKIWVSTVYPEKAPRKFTDEEGYVVFGYVKKRK